MDPFHCKEKIAQFPACILKSCSVSRIVNHMTPVLRGFVIDYIVTLLKPHILFPNPTAINSLWHDILIDLSAQIVLILIKYTGLNIEGFAEYWFEIGLYD